MDRMDIVDGFDALSTGSTLSMLSIQAALQR